MELLLWLWVYDKRWLLGFKPKVTLYIIAWIIPIVVNISMFSFYVYILNNPVISECKYGPYNLYLIKFTPEIILTIKSVLSFISTLLSVLLIKDIIMTKKSQIKKIGSDVTDVKAKAQVPIIIAQHDYWIRRKSLGNCNGHLLLLVGFIQIIWSIFFVFGMNSQVCDDNISKILFYNEMYEIVFFLPIVLVLTLSIIIKVSAFICAYTCPGFIVCLSRVCSCKRKSYKLDFSKNQFDHLGVLVKSE